MKGTEVVEVENINLLMEISELKTTISELYDQKGPGSADYIMLSIKLDVLTNEYLQEKIDNLIL